MNCDLYDPYEPYCRFVGCGLAHCYADISSTARQLGLLGKFSTLMGKLYNFLTVLDEEYGIIQRANAVVRWIIGKLTSSLIRCVSPVSAV